MRERPHNPEALLGQETRQLLHRGGLGISGTHLLDLRLHLRSFPRLKSTLAVAPPTLGESPILGVPVEVAHVVEEFLILDVHGHVQIRAHLAEAIHRRAEGLHQGRGRDALLRGDFDACDDLRDHRLRLLGHRAEARLDIGAQVLVQFRLGQPRAHRMLKLRHLRRHCRRSRRHRVPARSAARCPTTSIPHQRTHGHDRACRPNCGATTSPTIRLPSPPLAAAGAREGSRDRGLQRSEPRLRGYQRAPAARRPTAGQPAQVRRPAWASRRHKLRHRRGPSF
mmetsp:Transcript_90379/g.229816  ORF Transcript_90379/g.229816 Transcript_90379/m.229816 type:complete len:281 (+) Transcript_90379:734-1576(+)